MAFLILSNVIALLTAFAYSAHRRRKKKKKLTVELQRNVRRARDAECLSSAVTLGKLFLICQQRHRVFFFFFLNVPLPSYSLFQAQSEPPGPLGPLICMTGIGKSSAGLQTAAGRQPVF